MRNRDDQQYLQALSAVMDKLDDLHDEIEKLRLLRKAAIGFGESELRAEEQKLETKVKELLELYARMVVGL